MQVKNIIKHLPNSNWSNNFEKHQSEYVQGWNFDRPNIEVCMFIDNIYTCVTCTNWGTWLPLHRIAGTVVPVTAWCGIVTVALTFLYASTTQRRTRIPLWPCRPTAIHWKNQKYIKNMVLSYWFTKLISNKIMKYNILQGIFHSDQLVKQQKINY